jgi:hypothetical protein
VKRVDISLDACRSDMVAPRRSLGLQPRERKEPVMYMVNLTNPRQRVGWKNAIVRWSAIAGSESWCAICGFDQASEHRD